MSKVTVFVGSDPSKLVDTEFSLTDASGNVSQVGSSRASTVLFADPGVYELSVNGGTPVPVTVTADDLVVQL